MLLKSEEKTNTNIHFAIYNTIYGNFVDVIVHNQTETVKKLIQENPAYLNTIESRDGRTPLTKSIVRGSTETTAVDWRVRDN